MPRHYFAWADVDETTFGPEHEIEDVEIASWAIDHDEGDFPVLTLVVRNPMVGLLSAGRKTWGWLSYEDEDSIVTPLFFGQLVGVPTDLLGETVTLQFIAKPTNYKQRKQDVAEALKSLPFYDPIFLEPGQRDNPDAILEAYSSLYHIDRVTHEVSTSDILQGEDGEEIFGENGDVPYESLRIKLGQTPLKQVTIDASVGWTQFHIGNINEVVKDTVFSYTGDGIVGDWPAPLTDLQSGWSVRASQVIDNWGIAEAFVASYQDEVKNENSEHRNGDTLSVSWSISDPIFGGPSLQTYLTFKNIVGILDPYSIPQINKAAETNYTWLEVPKWSLTLSLSLRYEARRQRTERVKFTLKSNLQALVTDDEELSSEIVSLTGADVGNPILDVLDWLSVEDEDVEVGDVIMVNDPVDGTIYQICTTAGHTGTTQPDFSGILGVTTIDGTAIWTSLGSSLFSTDTPDWSAFDATPLGQVIRPKFPIVVAYTTLLPPFPHPTVGVSVSEGTIIRTTDGESYQQCTQAGTTGTSEPNWSHETGDVTIDGTVEWTCVGPRIPGSASFQICVGAGITGEFKPAFNETVGGTTLDGSVTWKCMGVNGGYIDTPIGLLHRRSYFPTDRGIKSIEYLLNLARARLRMRARAVEITWDCRFERMFNLSCRKNATIVDRRLPDGFARGKIIKYSMKADGDTGTQIGTITIGCAIGYSDAVTLVGGTPDYVEEGVLEPGIQHVEGQYVYNEQEDLVFSKPKDAVNDDGLVFPLTKNQVIVAKGMQGATVEEQEQAILDAFQYEGMIPPTANTLEGAIERQRLITLRNKKGVNAALRENARWYNLELRPVQNGPFEAIYELSVGDLSIPQMINLEAS